MHLVFLGAERDQEEKEDSGTGEGKGRLAEVEGRGGREGGGPEGRKEGTPRTGRGEEAQAEVVQANHGAHRRCSVNAPSLSQKRAQGREKPGRARGTGKKRQEERRWNVNCLAYSWRSLVACRLPQGKAGGAERRRSQK